MATKIVKKKIKSYAPGGIKQPDPTAGQNMAPITPQEREIWNNMQASAYQQGYRGSDHVRDLGVDFMKQHGVDPSRLSAYQQDFLNFSQTDPGRVKGAPDGWSAADNFYGHKTAQQRYTKYEYLHYDKNGNLYQGTAGHLDPSTTPLTQEQMNNWVNQGTIAGQWKSNDQNIPMPADVVDPRNQPVAAAPLTAKYPGVNKASWYEEGPTIAEQGGGDLRGMTAAEDAQAEYAKGGKKHWIQKAVNPAHKGYFKGGGKTSPVYVSSPNDPRYVNYQDSLHAYGLNKMYEDEAKRKGFTPPTGSIPYEIGKNIETLKGKRNYDNDHIHPERLVYLDMPGRGQVDLMPEYKKPEQEVRVGKDNTRSRIDQPYAPGIKSNIATHIKRIPYSWEMQSQPEFHPQQMQVPDLPPIKIPESGWYSNDKLVPIDASDEEVEQKLYNPDGSRKYAQGGYIHGGEYEVSDEEIRRLKKLGYKFDVL